LTVNEPTNSLIAGVPQNIADIQQMIKPSICRSAGVDRDPIVQANTNSPVTSGSSGGTTTDTGIAQIT
jgi:hypothetical protein